MSDKVPPDDSDRRYGMDGKMRSLLALRLVLKLPEAASGPGASHLRCFFS